MSVRCDTSYVFDKGLSNNIGHNNCFLNSAVQVLWHLDIFRKNFLALKYHFCVHGPCIYCSLQDIFNQFKESEEDVLHPDMLRVTLATTFEDQMKFQLGEVDDASECYENILSRIHFHLSKDIQDDCCSLEHCITHRKFAMSLIQQSECLCGSTSEPLSYMQLVHFVSTSSIINFSDKEKYTNFGKVLKLAFKSGFSSNPCSIKCGLASQVTHTLVNLPDVVSIGLIWESDQSDPEHIKKFVSTIETSIYLEDIFEKVVEGNGQSLRELVGVVCYYLKHYSTFFFHSKKNIWISFDDASVTQIGKHWSNVVDKCCKGRYQPLLLIYQNPKADLIDLSTAPCVMSYKDKAFPHGSDCAVNKAMRNKSSDSSLAIRMGSFLKYNDNNNNSNNYFHPQVSAAKPCQDFRDALHESSPVFCSNFSQSRDIGKPKHLLDAGNIGSQTLHGFNFLDEKNLHYPILKSPLDGNNQKHCYIKQQKPQGGCFTTPWSDCDREHQTNIRGNHNPEHSALPDWTIIGSNTDAIRTKSGSSSSVYDNFTDLTLNSPKYSEYPYLKDVHVNSTTEKPSHVRDIKELEVIERNLMLDKVRATYR